MVDSLQSYHFSSIKFGEIVKQYAKERGMSKAGLAGKVGVSYDTMDNIYRGAVQKIPFELVFKISCALGVPMEVIELLWIKDDDINFRDMILHYDAHQDKTVLIPDEVPSFVPNAVADTAAAVAALDTPLAASDTLHGPDGQPVTAERLSAVYAAYVADLKEQFGYERANNTRYFQLMTELVMHLCGEPDPRRLML